HDPDSFIKEFGSAAFRNLLAQAEGFFDFHLNYLCSTFDIQSDQGRSAVVRAMAEAVQKTANEVQIDKYAQKTALRLAVSADAVRAECKKVRPPRTRTAMTADAAPSPTVHAAPRPSAHEFWLLKLLLLDDELIGWAITHLDPNWVQHRTVQRVISRRFEAE